MKRVICILIFFATTSCLFAQGQIKWAKDGNSYFRMENGELVQYTLPSRTKTVLVS